MQTATAVVCNCGLLLLYSLYYVTTLGYVHTECGRAVQRGAERSVVFRCEVAYILRHAATKTTAPRVTVRAVRAAQDPM